MGSLDEKISVVKAKPWLVSLVCAVFIAYPNLAHELSGSERSSRIFTLLWVPFSLLLGTYLVFAEK